MSQTTPQGTSRREFLKRTGQAAAASALVAGAVPRVHAAENNTIQLVLVGCGGRGTGAAANAMSVGAAPIKLVAMADVFENRLKGSLGNLKNKFANQVDVPPERQFIGFDAYRKAMDCLKPGDIAIFATPLGFRWVHYGYAVEKGLNVFMEKPLTADGPTSRRLIQLAEQATAKNLKAGVGLMSRHSRALEQLAERIHGGEIGEVILMRGYRMHGPIGHAASTPKPEGMSDLLYQVQRFHSFLWAGGGCYSDFLVHIIDHLGWMKNAWPVKAQGVGGRHYDKSPDGRPYVDQNFDSYSVEYTFADGTKFFMDGRCMNGCKPIYHSYAHGSKGSAVVSAHGDCGQPSRIFKGQDPGSEKVWESQVPGGEGNPYQNEWNDLVDAILTDKPYNEVKRGVEASVVTSMGRRAAHSGQEITFDAMLNCEQEYAPGLDKITMDSPAPVQPDENGMYPQPQPGLKGDREY